MQHSENISFASQEEVKLSLMKLAEVIHQKWRENSNKGEVCELNDF